jgi:hypothetical protein
MKLDEQARPGQRTKHLLCKYTAEMGIDAKALQAKKAID